MPEKKPEVKKDASGRKYIKKNGKRHYLKKRVSKRVSKKKKTIKKLTKHKRSGKSRGTKRVAASGIIVPASGSSVSTAAVLGMMNRQPITVVDSGSKVDSRKISRDVSDAVKALMPPKSNKDQRLIQQMSHAGFALSSENERLAWELKKNNKAKEKKKVEDAYDNSLTEVIEELKGKKSVGTWLGEMVKKYKITGVGTTIAARRKPVIEKIMKDAAMARVESIKQLKRLKQKVAALEDEYQEIVDDEPPNSSPTPPPSSSPLIEDADENEEKYPLPQRVSPNAIQIPNLLPEASPESRRFADMEASGELDYDDLQQLQHEVDRQPVRDRLGRAAWMLRKKHNQEAALALAAKEREEAKQRQNTFYDMMSRLKKKRDLEAAREIDTTKLLSFPHDLSRARIGTVYPDIHGNYTSDYELKAMLQRAARLAEWENRAFPEERAMMEGERNYKIARQWEEMEQLAEDAAQDPNRQTQTTYASTFPLPEADQEGLGKRSNANEGLSTDQINLLMRDYPDYLGCVARDQINMLNIERGKRFGYVMNLDPHNKPGSHWIAVYVDNRPGGENVIEYYNSLADQPTERVLHDLRRLVAYLKPEGGMMKFKVNKIADQDDSSANCGFFAAKFLMDRFNGVPFAEATGYNQASDVGEAKIELWKMEHGIHNFRGLGRSYDEDGQTGQGIYEVVRNGFNYAKRAYNRVKETLKGVRKHASPSVRQWLEKHGDVQISDVVIARKPIYSMIEKLANLFSSGQWEKNKEKLSYDRMFHLFMLIRLSDGTVAKVEKNQVVEIKSARWGVDRETEHLKYSIANGKTMNELVKGAEAKVGAEKVWVYDARTQNCQFFLKWLLSDAGGWTKEIEQFVMQDAEKVLEGLGVLGDVARVITDIAGVADVAMNGAGRRRGRGGRR